MKKHITLIVLGSAVLFSVLVIAFVLVPYGKSKIKENALVKAENEIKLFLENESDFDAIIEYLEADNERKHFLGVTLVKLAEQEEKYATNFEARYPRYKAYRDMVKELARHDYSEWVASIIANTVNEFEANVFEYLATLKDRRYLNEAISRFIFVLNNSDTNGFSAKTNKDAFIIGSLAQYIIQFPENNALLRTALGEKADLFIRLTENRLGDIQGLPLNQAYLYLYLKYFGLENLIARKMEEFIDTGTRGWDGTTWTMGAVEGLIQYFTSSGKGMVQNYYSLFNANNKNASIRIYIGLQVLKQIGFDDPSLNNVFNIIARRSNDLEIITTTTRSGSRLILPSQSTQTRRQIIFSEEVAETRRAIAGKTDIPFDQILNSALVSSSQNGNFIVPRVTAIEVINREISQISGLYTNTFISNSITSWEKKNADLNNMLILEIIIATVICLLVYAKTRKSYNYSGRFSSLSIPYSIFVALSFIVAIIINLSIAGR